MHSALRRFWSQSNFSRLPIRRSRAFRGTAFRPRLELLEQRALLATFTVTNTATSGPGSLAEAIAAANASLNSGGPDEVHFNIPTSDSGYQPATQSFTIPLVNELNVTEAVVIDGYTQPGASKNALANGTNAVLKIELDGSAASGAALRLGGGGSIVQGLVVNRFAFADTYGGAIVMGSDNNTLAGNFIGVDVTGTVDLGNEIAVFVGVSNENNTIGGTTPEARNVVSGNNRYGINDRGSHTLIQGNLFGTDRTGTLAVGNYISIHSISQHLTIGGSTPGARNIISGSVAGVLASADPDLRIQGNYIGTDVTGTQALGNQGGLVVNRCAGIVGGVTPETRNVISGNTEIGILLDNTSSLLRVHGNYVGLDVTGANALRNITGVAMWGASVLGGTGASEGNVISGNNIGVRFSGTENVVIGNLIGTDATGTLGRGNGTALYMGGTNGTIGGSAPGARNVISDNLDAIYFESEHTTGHKVQGNYIGTDITGTQPLGNWRSVTFRYGARNNLIGGAGPWEGNRIAFNFHPGVVVDGSGGAGNAVLGNSMFDNGGLGIDLGGAPEGNGVTLNDAGDGDVGSNNLQNFPVLASASRTMGGTHISGTLNSLPNTTFRIEFFANVVADPSGYGEGKLFLGATNVTTDGGGNATISFTAAAAPAGELFISSTATQLVEQDSELVPRDTSEFSQVVVLPANSPPSGDAGGPYTVVRGGTVQLDASGTSDLEQANTTLTYQWDFDNDGQYDDATGMRPIFSAAGLEAQLLTVKLLVTDAAGATDSDTAVVNIIVAGLVTDPCDQTKLAYGVGGGGDDDIIRFAPGPGAGEVEAFLNGVSLGVFQPSGGLLAYGQAGTDDIQVAGSIDLDAWLFGQGGDDRLKGGGGDDVILGGEGDDLLVGSGGRDLLVGENGADRIVGNSDDDIMIAGRLQFANLTAALCAIMEEWTRRGADDPGYQTRIARLSGTAGGRNGGYFLQVNETVVDDGDDSEDVLTGSTGNDWFFFWEPEDRATDLNDEVFANDLAFINA